MAILEGASSNHTIGGTLAVDRTTTRRARAGSEVAVSDGECVSGVTGGIETYRSTTTGSSVLLFTVCCASNERTSNEGI